VVQIDWKERPARARGDNGWGDQLVLGAVWVCYYCSVAVVGVGVGGSAPGYLLRVCTRCGRWLYGR